MVTILTHLPIPYGRTGPYTTDPKEMYNITNNTDAIFAVIENKRTNMREKLEALMNFISAGQDINTKNYSGDTPLICCARKRFLDGCRILLESGCDVNIPDKTGKTALHWCFLGSVEANAELVQMLLKFGANTNIKDISETSPMHLALISGNKYVFEMMTTHNGDLSELKARNCVDLIRRFGFRLNFDIEVVIRRLYLLGCPLSECRKMIPLLKLWYIDCDSASAFLDKITDTVPRLTELSRLQVRKCLSKSSQCGQIRDLDLPPSLQRFTRMDSLEIEVVNRPTVNVQDPLLGITTMYR